MGPKSVQIYAILTGTVRLPAPRHHQWPKSRTAYPASWTGRPSAPGGSLFLEPDVAQIQDLGEAEKPALTFQQKVCVGLANEMSRCPIIVDIHSSQ